MMPANPYQCTVVADSVPDLERLAAERCLISVDGFDKGLPATVPARRAGLAVARDSVPGSGDAPQLVEARS